MSALGRQAEWLKLPQGAGCHETRRAYRATQGHRFRKLILLALSLLPSIGISSIINEALYEHTYEDSVISGRLHRTRKITGEIKISAQPARDERCGRNWQDMAGKLRTQRNVTEMAE